MSRFEKMRWFERQRMIWISKRRKPFRRADLIAAFDISIPQASKDISKYRAMFPDALTYNTKKKIYEVNP